jgi:hypothetical protein
LVAAWFPRIFTSGRMPAIPPGDSGFVSMQPGGDLLDYRARAAACRAKAEKAGEYPGEANTWLQVAAMWDGLADRLERGADPVPSASATAEPDASPIAEACPNAGPEPGEELPGQELPQRELPRQELPLREVPRTPALPVAESAGPRSPQLRRLVVVAGLLLVSLAAILWLWPRTDRPKHTAERAGRAETAAMPQPPAAPRATALPAAEEPSKTAAASPAQEAPIQAPVQTGAATSSSPGAAASPAAVPSEVRPEPPKAEPDARAAGQGAESAAPGAAPPPVERGPSLPTSADTAPAALPPPEPPAVAAQFGPAAGTWWPEACPTAAERRTVVPMILSEDRARAGASSCTFQKKTPAPNGWAIVARCSDGRESWTAHIRLVHAGKRLQWASERGSLTYFRCS